MPYKPAKIIAICLLAFLLSPETGFTTQAAMGWGQVSAGEIRQDVENPVVDCGEIVVTDLGDGIYLIEVEATNSGDIERVDFSHWDRTTESFVVIASDDSAPYQAYIDLNPFPPGFIEISIHVFCTSGESSGRCWLWLYHLPSDSDLFLPGITKS